MYRAKDAGRNTYRFYTQEMNEQMHHRMQIENNMRLALEREELFLEFQPVIDHRTGEVVSAEALVRWDHPSLGCLGPDRFIAIAEESGLIDRVGVWVLRTAAREARRWQDSGLGEIPVSVNISSQQLKLGLSRATLQSVLEETQLPASRLNLEITESLLIDDSSKALTWLEECRQMGLKLYIDDFGTGYSSLSYLKKFPVDVLKIDKSFIRDISTDPDDATLVEAIITLAHSFNLRVIAEGVEDDVQLAFLCDLDCDLIQGFYYSRPLKSADFIHYVRQANHRSLQRKEQQR
jgi:EAL domain-containing protein (putative c-di-GMP-specific phosphodiesterase class I)